VAAFLAAGMETSEGRPHGALHSDRLRADVAFTSLLGGQAELTGMQITVASPDDLPLDAPEELVVLG
jgi:hypothetical protein